VGQLSPLLRIVRRRHLVVRPEAEALPVLCRRQPMLNGEVALQYLLGLPQIGQTRWSGRIDRRTETASSPVDNAASAGVLPKAIRQAAD
jgi:hypothetical protein